jgi:hypothetical protein
MTDKFQAQNAAMFDRLIGSLVGYEKNAVEALHPAARAGAELLYTEMRRKAPVGTKPSRIHGKTYPPGTLRDAIYHAFSDENSTDTRRTFHIGPNKRKAGHWHWIEHGHFTTTQKRFDKKRVGPAKARFVPAQPYIRPTWDTYGRLAVERMKATMKARLAQSKGKR